MNCSNCLTGEPAKVNTGLITHPPDGCDNCSDIASYQQRLAPDMRAAEIGRCMKESVCRDRLPHHKLAARCHQLLPCSQDRQDFVHGCCVPSYLYFSIAVCAVLSHRLWRSLSNFRKDLIDPEPIGFMQSPLLKRLLIWFTLAMCAPNSFILLSRPG